MFFSVRNNFQELILTVGRWHPHGFLGPPESASPNGISIVSAVLAGHMRATNTPTDRPRYMQHT